MTKRVTPLLFVAIFTFAISAVAQRRIPTVDDLLTIKSVGGAQISPDGKWIAYTVGYGDFKQALSLIRSGWSKLTRPGHFN